MFDLHVFADQILGLNPDEVLLKGDKLIEGERFALIDRKTDESHLRNLF